MPWYFYKKNGSQKIERRDDDQPGIVKLTAVGPTLTAGTEAEAKTAQAGYLYCNGAPVLISEFTDLWNAFGTTDKFKGSNPAIVGKFYLPDYRGNVPMGSGTGYTMAARGGSSAVSYTLPQHNHQMPHTHTVDNHSHGMNHNHTGPNHNHTYDHTHGATGSTGQASSAFVSYADSDYIRIEGTVTSGGASAGTAHTHQVSIYTTAIGTPAFSRQGHTHPSVSTTTNSQSANVTGDSGTGVTGDVQNGPNGLNTGGATPGTGQPNGSATTTTSNNTAGTTIPSTPNNNLQPYQTCNFIIKI